MKRLAGAVELPPLRQKCRSRVRPVEAPIDDTPPAPACAVHSRRLGGARRRRRDNAIERASHAGLARADAALAAFAGSTPASIMSGCPTGRWAIPRSGTPISAPAGSSCRICRASTRRSPTARWRACRPLREFIAKLKASGGTAMSSGCCRRAACIRTRIRSRRLPRSSPRPGFRSRCMRCSTAATRRRNRPSAI